MGVAERAVENSAGQCLLPALSCADGVLLRVLVLAMLVRFSRLFGYVAGTWVGCFRVLLYLTVWVWALSAVMAHDCVRSLRVS